MEISDLHVEHMGTKEGREFIMEHHYTGTCSTATMCWGCYDGDRLVGVCGFATPISEAVRKFIWKDEYKEDMKHHTTELHRLVTLDEAPHNTETWFISRALKGLKEYKPKYKAIISHADMTEGHKGTIYQASNAMYTGTTAAKDVYVDEEGKLHPKRQGGENIGIEEAKERGWEIEEREAKYRYVFLLPDNHGESKEDIKEKLSVEDKPYPKK